MKIYIKLNMYNIVFSFTLRYGSAIRFILNWKLALLSY